MSSLPKARRAAKRGVSVEEQTQRDDAAAKKYRRDAYEKRCAKRAEKHVGAFKNKKPTADTSNARNAAKGKRKRQTIAKRKIKIPKTKENITKETVTLKANASSVTPPSETMKALPATETTRNDWSIQADPSVVQANMEVVYRVRIAEFCMHGGRQACI